MGLVNNMADDVIRIKKLNDGDVFRFINKTLLFNDGLFYEVCFGGFDKFMQSKWRLKGNVNTSNDINVIFERNN